MIRANRRLLLPLLTVVSLLWLPSCKSSDGTETETVVATPGGAMVVDTFKVTATVSAIDAAKGKMTLTSPDGAKTTVKAAQGVDVNRFKVGDRVTATVTEELAVFLGGPGAPSAGVGSTVAVAADGPNRAVMMADTAQVTAKITNIDTKHRKVTLQFPDGKSKTVKVGQAVNLANAQVGNDVTVQVAESLVLSVERPPAN